MKNEYRREMERLGPSREELERLCTMIEEGTLMKQKKRLGIRAAAILACAVLMMITAAVAAAPTVWDALTAHLGVFAPYARTIEGPASTDQGIELRVLSALSDDQRGVVYFSVRDMEQDRLDQCLALTGLLTACEEKKADTPLTVIGHAASQFDLVSYNPETKTALFSVSAYYGEAAQPTRDAQLTVTGMTTRQGRLYGGVSCATVTDQALESLPAEGEIIFRPSDIANAVYTDAVLPNQIVALAPEQNPVSIEGTEDMWVSSMGFAGDGCFHIRLGLAEGVRPEKQGFFTDLFQLGSNDARLYTYQETLVTGGMDILFPLIHVEDLALVQSCTARFYGPYTRPGMDIEGLWSTEFQLDYYPSITLDWTGKLAGWQIRQVTVSPLSVAMRSNASGGLSSLTLYAVKKDGSVVTAEPSTSRYSNLGAYHEGESWDAFNTWEFQEPVAPEDLAFLKLGDETIPVS